MSFKLPDRYVKTRSPLKGGMGAVLVCKDNNLERDVAIKYIQNIKDKKRLMDEISALQRIRSKYVVEIYDIIVDASTNDVAIVEDFIPGLDLYDIAKKRPTGDDYLKLIYQLSSGINEIHEQGLIHRDINPNNIKLDGENIIKIFDFGLAIIVGPDAKTSGFKGTRGFFAPELFTQGMVCFSTAVDVYAFGATAIYLAEDALPKDMLKLPPELNNIPSFASLDIDIPDEIAQLLDRTLSENPIDRPVMVIIRDTIAKYLLFEKHSAQIVNVSRGELYTCDRARKIIKIKSANNEMQVGYDGLDFKIGSVSGDVYINNTSASIGDSLPGSCVITLGPPQHERNRVFLTFDISHPEIIL